ncbi:MAG TPA: NUDIX hydrolase [Chromatiales bacterium]|nr:NUDIX hydrolase [Thiotrichales bacterium]HIP68695.1 NUDIX hydrolase [Chromatiales bacterium]
MQRPVTPLLAVDTIIRLLDHDNKIVLIERKNPPYGWALPGGFVDVGERLEVAAVREAKEETCLDVDLVALLGIYSDPTRDPRGHTVTPVYIADARGEPVAADDAKNVKIFDAVNIDQPLAFDHELILSDYHHYLETGELAPLRY